ncbi:hypothetical protein EDEG_04175, partial [Edhazardia aedis USNM 41457]
ELGRPDNGKMKAEYHSHHQSILENYFSQGRIPRFHYNNIYITFSIYQIALLEFFYILKQKNVYFFYKNIVWKFTKMFFIMFLIKKHYCLQIAYLRSKNKQYRFFFVFSYKTCTILKK